MDTDECDVLVVGLGPAGAAAATAAAQAGVRVLAIERRQALGGVANCPEFIPMPIGPHAGTDQIVIQSIFGAREHVHGSQSEGLLAGCVVDRDAFDRALVDFSRAAGARLSHNTVLADLDADLSEATLSLSGRSCPLRYRALVAADGHASAVARLLGLPPLMKMYTLRYRVPLLAPRQEVEVWQSPRYPGGYGWLIPAGNQAVVAAGMAKEIAHAALSDLHRQLVMEGTVGSAILGQSAGAVPIEGLRPKLTRGNILFAGDAGGLAHPLTGAGIHPAVISGEAAGQAAASWSGGDLGAISAYEAKMRGLFGESMARALRDREPLQVSIGTELRAPSDTGWSAVRGAFAR